MTHEPIARKFQETLRTLRSTRGLTYQAIAEALSAHLGGQVPENTVKRWFAETNPTVPNLEHLVGLAKIFGVSLNELLGDADDIARTVPHPIEFQDQALIRLVRHPRPDEENGVEIARRLCQEEPPEEICKRLRIGDAELERQLRRAAYGDLFEVIEPVQTDDDSAWRLKEKYHLQVCEVAPIDSMRHGILQTVILGALGAKIVRERQQGAPQAVGLAGGFSCARLTISLVQGSMQSEGLKLMPIAVQGSLGEYTAMNANTLVGMFGYLMGRRSSADVTIVQYVSNADLVRNPTHPTQQLLDHIVRQVSIAFLGLGGNVRWFFNGVFRSPTPMPEGAVNAVTGAELSAAGCRGDILYNFVGEHGIMPAYKPVCDQMVCSIGLKGLKELTATRKIPVVAIVADEYKAPVVWRALHDGYINGLITTSAVAAELQAKAPAQR
jgi:DNA-binding transcriptional regulator LsrR (DeoR family)